MAALTSSDVTYSTPLDQNERRLEGTPPHYEAKVSVSFGDGAKTYPTNGVPLDASKLGMPQAQLEGVLIYDEVAALAAGTLWVYDDTHKTLRGFTAIGTEKTGAVAATTIKVLARGY